MDYIYVGKFVNTHGLKGELRILSDFKYKDLIFKNGFKLYVGKDKNELTIVSYRKHKIFDMVTLSNIDSIDDALNYKGLNVYINKSDIKINGYFDEDLIGLEVYSQKGRIGIVTNILKGIAQDLIEVDNKHLIPNIAEFVELVDLKNHKIVIKEIEGLINED